MRIKAKEGVIGCCAIAKDFGRKNVARFLVIAGNREAQYIQSLKYAFLSQSVQGVPLATEPGISLTFWHPSFTFKF